MNNTIASITGVIPPTPPTTGNEFWKTKIKFCGKNLSCVGYFSVFLQPKAHRVVADAAKLINKTHNPDRPTFFFGLPRTTDPKRHSVCYFPALKTVAVEFKLCVGGGGGGGILQVLM